jgi:exonuclease SbcC
LNNKLGRFVERREHYADHLKALNLELTRLKREVDSLEQECAAFDQLDQEIATTEQTYKACQQADQQVRQLPGLLNQVEQLQMQVAQHSSDFDEKKRAAEPLKGSREQLAARQLELAALGDPQLQTKTQQEIIKHEPAVQHQYQEAQEQLKANMSQADELSHQLAQYARLDQAIGEQEATRQQAAAGYQLYQRNIDLASKLPARETLFTTASQQLDLAVADLAQADAALQEARVAFDEREFVQVADEISGLDKMIARLATDMTHIQQRITAREVQIAGAEALLVELTAAQQERQTLEDLSATMQQFRTMIKDAAPFVLRAMLADISAEANRIFGEIMGDRSAQLVWSDDYEISLTRQGNRRVFAQLSGGEQMSAALAVRLALLKKLSTLNLAFFDEPTQNMDEQRRTNLAEQIRRVRGFEQLLVISHDDTFEQSLDSLIRLQKQDGQTRLLGEDEDMVYEEETSAREIGAVAPGGEGRTSAVAPGGKLTG